MTISNQQQLNEIDRSDWDRAWGAQTVRLLPDGCKLDVSHHFPGQKLCEVTIAIDPPQYADRPWRESEICPVCGQATLTTERIAASLDVKYEQGLRVGMGVWAHKECIEICKDTGLSAGVPW